MQHAFIAALLIGGCMLQACNQQSAPADLAENGIQGCEPGGNYPVPRIPEEAKPEQPAMKGVNDLTGLPMDEAKESTGLWR